MNDTTQITVGGSELAVYDRGSNNSGGGSPIVFVHGFPLDHTMWRAQLEAFAPTHRVIAPDLRGFGESPVRDGIATMEQMADDLVALLDALSVRQPVVLCGLSMGGYVAIEFLRKYAPRVRALILCDTRSAADTPETAANRHKTAELALSQGAAPVAEAMLPRLAAPDARARQRTVVESLKQTMLATDPRTIAAALRGMAARSDSTPRLASIRVPTLVVVGQYDAITPVAEMRQMAKAIPHARFVVIPDAGHMAPMENPAAVNQAIAALLAELSSPSP